MTETGEWAAFDSFSFGDSPELAEELAHLVLAGVKRATCWPFGEGPKTHPGKRWVMRDGSGAPAAVIETVGLALRRFGEVDEAHAFEEGEGDRTLAYWREAHRRYFTRQGVFAPDMQLWCERFRLVARLPAFGSAGQEAGGRWVLPQFEIGSLSYVLRLLAVLALRVRIFLNAIKNVLMLRRPRSGRLEARTALMQFQTDALPGDDHL